MDTRILDWAEKISAGSMLIGLFQKDQGVFAAVFGLTLMILVLKLERGKK